MREYHKIQSVFMRDPDTNHKTFLDGQFTLPEFEYLRDNKWVWTEKVDGMNIRIGWEGDSIEIGGRTERAQVPAILIKRLMELFPAEKFMTNFETPTKGDPGIILFGEGYGAKIQKGGGNYIPDGVDFVLFDVMIGGFWLERHNVEDIAGKLGIEVVPIVGEGTLMEAIEMTKPGFDSWKGTAKSEGLVVRTKVEMLTRRGQRLITKIKTKDFVHEQKEAMTISS